MGFFAGRRMRPQLGILDGMYKISGASDNRQPDQILSRFFAVIYTKTSRYWSDCNEKNQYLVMLSSAGMNQFCTLDLSVRFSMTARRNITYSLGGQHSFSTLI